MIIDPHTRKCNKLCETLVNSVFKYQRYQREGTTFQKTTSKKQLVKAIEEAHEFLEGAGKIVKIKPPKRVTTYSTGASMVHLINLE